MVMVLVAPRRKTPLPANASMGARLKALRERRGLIQSEVAERLGISYKTVSAYENDRAVLGSDDFPKWSEALGVSVAELTSSLGLGLPAGSGHLRMELAALYGPDSGEEVERILRELADLPDTDQRQIIDSISDQVSGRHARRQRDN